MTVGHARLKDHLATLSLDTAQVTLVACFRIRLICSFCSFSSLSNADCEKPSPGVASPVVSQN